MYFECIRIGEIARMHSGAEGERESLRQREKTDRQGGGMEENGRRQEREEWLVKWKKHQTGMCRDRNAARES